MLKRAGDVVDNLLHIGMIPEYTYILAGTEP